MDYGKIILEVRSTKQRFARTKILQKKKLLSGSKDWITANYQVKDGRFQKRKEPLNLSDVHKTSEKKARVLKRFASKTQASRARVKSTQSHLGGQTFSGRIQGTAHTSGRSFKTSTSVNKTQKGDTSMPKKSLGVVPTKNPNSKPKASPKPKVDLIKKKPSGSPKGSPKLKKDPTVKTSVKPKTPSKNARAQVGGVDKARSSGHKFKSKDRA